jgi:hypothetical protein
MNHYLIVTTILSAFLFSSQATAGTLNCAGVIKGEVNDPEYGVMTVGVDATLTGTIKKGSGTFSLNNKWDEPITGSISNPTPSTLVENRKSYTISAPDPDGDKAAILNGTLVPLMVLHEEDPSEYWIFTLKNPGLSLSATMRCTAK